MVLVSVIGTSCADTHLADMCRLALSQLSRWADGVLEGCHTMQPNSRGPPPAPLPLMEATAVPAAAAAAALIPKGKFASV